MSSGTDKNSFLLPTSWPGVGAWVLLAFLLFFAIVSLWVWSMDKVGDQELGGIKDTPPGAVSEEHSEKMPGE